MILQAIWTREEWIQMELETQLRNRLAQAIPNLDGDPPVRLGGRAGSIAPADGTGDRR
jgi:hypothetical protein